MEASPGWVEQLRMLQQKSAGCGMWTQVDSSQSPICSWQRGWHLMSPPATQEHRAPQPSSNSSWILYKCPIHTSATFSHKIIDMILHLRSFIVFLRSLHIVGPYRSNNSSGIANLNVWAGISSAVQKVICEQNCLRPCAASDIELLDGSRLSCSK